MTELNRLFSVWRHTRLVVLVSVIAAIHAAALIPFKPIQLLPGVTDVRPAMVLPVVFSLLFGPAAAWGTAIGNTIGDLYGSLGPGTFFGFVGNLLYGYVPWRVWTAWREGNRPTFRTLGDWAAYTLALVGASGSCALFIGWGIHILGFFPFETTSGIILFNNLLVGIILGPPFFLALHPRVAGMGLLYRDIVYQPPPTSASRVLARAVSIAVAAVAAGGIVAGYVAAVSGASDAGVTAATTPFVGGVLLAVILL